ncbi:MAG: hypothetical protein IT323_17555 [Anaerolineae bacterium]|nr:hypothetical protein [Anaerolineae bacterium]
MGSRIAAPPSPDWQQIYVRCDDASAVESALRDRLAALSYHPYDPFPGGIGTPPGLKDFVRLFLTPPLDGWLAILGACPPDVRDTLLVTLEACGPVLVAWLAGPNSDMARFVNGALDPDALGPFLRPDMSPDDVQRVRTQKLDVSEPPPKQSTLPGELDQLARSRNVDPGQAARLMDRLTGSLFGKLDRQSGGEASAVRNQARALLEGKGKGGPDWGGVGGRRLIALATLLTLPPTWREPGFETIRDAYGVARRLQRNPRASLLPDERDAHARVPNALDYTPLYFGR